MKFNLCLWVLTGMIFYAGSSYALSDENRPDYQKEYDSYLKDLEVIAKTGKAPKNLDLEEDLAKMSSNEKILLTVNHNSGHELRFAENSDDLNDTQIVNSVEIVRVPEEFRQEYEAMYEEENKTISAQSLVDSQYDLQKKAVAEASPKTIDHINPFRFLKEVALSPLPSEMPKLPVSDDPMVNAYFNQFGRPYVEGADSDEAYASKSSAQVSPTAGTLGLKKGMYVY